MPGGHRALSYGYGDGEESNDGCGDTKDDRNFKFGRHGDTKRVPELLGKKFGSQSCRKGAEVVLAAKTFYRDLCGVLRGKAGCTRIVGQG